MKGLSDIFESPGEAILNIDAWLGDLDNKLYVNSPQGYVNGPINY